jgi:hypothetical protein
MPYSEINYLSSSNTSCLSSPNIFTQDVKLFGSSGLRILYKAAPINPTSQAINL